MLPIGVATTYSAAAGYCCPCASSERGVMRQKTQTDRTRPPLCHAVARESGGPRPPAVAHNFSRPTGSKLVGAAFEARAMEFLQRQRLRLVARNVLCRGGEIDLVMRER